MMKMGSNNDNTICIVAKLNLNSTEAKITLISK